MKTTWTEIVKNKMKETGVSQDKLGEMIGKTQGAIGHWLNGRRQPSVEEIAEMMKALNLTEIILNSDGSASLSTDNNIKAPKVIKESATDSFPVVSWVSAGNWSEAIENTSLIDKWSNTNAKVSYKSFWLEVKGSSMTAPSGLSIPEGMLILVDPEKEYKSGSLVVAKLENDNEATFKKYVEDGGNRYLVGLNPNWPVISIREDCKIIGVVVEAKWDSL
ncbi:LexA family protein [Thorsellia anophelis]|nr:LexA family transcriptional regulator [Thorsellia anophelis]